MTRELGFTIALIGVAWLGYMAWLTGYRNGYVDGSDKAMQRVEQLMPTVMAESVEREAAEKRPRLPEF